MYLESDARLLLPVCFALVMALALGALLLLYRKSRRKELLWLAGQLVFLCGAFIFFYRCVQNLPDSAEMHYFYTETQSLTIAMAGICWAVSMGLMVVGIVRLLRRP